MEVTEPLMIGDYKIIQDTARYRFTSDAVLLARFLRAKKGEVVADLCAGSGIVGLHFFAENECVRAVVLFEMQKALAEMSARTVALNGLEERFTVENVRVQEIPARYHGKFSLVLANPPFLQARATAPEDPCKSEAELTLTELIKAAKKCLKEKGRFAVVHRADRTAELLAALKKEGLEPKKMQFVAGKEGRKPYAVLVAAVKGGKTGIEVLPTRVNGAGT